MTVVEELTELLKDIGGIYYKFHAKHVICIVDGNEFTNFVGIGWIPLITNLIRKLVVLGWNRQLAQCKEKFGGLRWYIDTADQWPSLAIVNEIRLAENLSFQICEKCGLPGEKRSTSWIQTLCDNCYTKMGDK